MKFNIYENTLFHTLSVNGGMSTEYETGEQFQLFWISLFLLLVVKFEVIFIFLDIFFSVGYRCRVGVYAYTAKRCAHFAG